MFSGSRERVHWEQMHELIQEKQDKSVDIK